MPQSKVTLSLSFLHCNTNYFKTKTVGSISKLSVVCGNCLRILHEDLSPYILYNNRFLLNRTNASDTYVLQPQSTTLGISLESFVLISTFGYQSKPLIF